MKKRLLAMLLVLMLVVSLLPTGALAANSMSYNQYFTLDYDNGGVLDRTITVNLFDPDGKQIDMLTVNNAKGAQYNYTIALTSSISSQYDIEGMSITGGNPGSSSISNDSLSFWLGLTTEYDGCTVNVYLCPEYKDPDFPNDEIDTGATIEYIAYEPALLKLLYVNGVTGVDENTEINGVEFNFVQNYTGDDFEFLRVGTGANNLMYYTAVLSDVADRGNPRNIRSIDISYTLSDGTEETLRVYSGDLRYIKIDADTYEIEANNDDTSIVAFYNQPGAQYSTWSLYDVKFVNTGDALGDENMPETPTYPATEYDFTNWDKNVGGGSPFLPNEEIDDDTVVYAMKTSSSTGGTEFHVMNTNNVLLDRIVEKYNAENNTEYGISDIVLDSVRIQVNGADDESTNPNYFSNRWESPGNPYYHVNNGGIVGSHEIYSNTHIPHGEVRSITVFATTTDGKNIEVNIPRSNNCGDASISLVQDNIVEIIINAPPEKPSDDDLDVDPDDPGDTGLLESAVTVTCTNTDVKHDAQTFDLLPNSFSIGDVVYTTEGYTCTVTVNADAYVTDYSNSTENGTHKLTEGESSTKTIKLVYSGNSWTVPADATPVNFNVTCDTGDPGEPTDPEKPGEADLEKLSVTLDCVTADVEHEDGAFKLESSNCTVADVVASAEGVYTCVVTPNYVSILASYNGSVDVEHTYTDDTAPVFNLTWNADTEAWVADETSITRSVQCESTELPDDYVAEYHVMNLYDELDIIAEKWGHEDYIGFYLNGKDGSTLGAPGDDLSEGNEWNNDRSYYTVNNGAYDSEDYMAYTEVDGLHFYYDTDPDATFTYRDIDILVTEPDENHVSKIYVLFDIRLYDDYNNGYWYDTDQDGNPDWVVYKAQRFTSIDDRWKAGSKIILEDLATADGSQQYYKPTHADVNDRDVVFLGWDVKNHETIYEPGDEPDNLIKDAFSITEDVLSNCNITPLEVCLYGVYGYAEPDTITIEPADIVAYTGGEAYSGIVGENGSIIEGTQTSGLPEPGYHITLPDWVNELLADADMTNGSDLAGKLTFSYNGTDSEGNTVERSWNLVDRGVYSIDPYRYVYSLETADGGPEVRIQYRNGNEIMFDDDITFSPDSVNAEYVMSIYPGLLNQEGITATLTIGNETYEFKTAVETGTLKILATVQDNVTSDDDITAEASEGTEYFVNDSEVNVDPNRVELLVDDVTNVPADERTLANSAIDAVQEHLDSELDNAAYEMNYLDLVDTANGNTKVNFNGTMTISWPIPDDAAEGTQFHVVHYFNMDRTTEDADLESYEVKEATVSDGTITFTTTSFSPFVLVYEAEERTPIIPTPDPDDDTEYVPKWLNTEDHFAYIVGYEDGEVKPNNNITRAEVATIFFRLLTDNARARYWSQTNDYSDIAPESWYNNAVSTLSNMGIINGYEDGTFKPNAPITRAEFTAIATRFFDYTAEYDGAFNDVSRSAWYADCVQAAVDMGLVDGYPDGGFHPNSNITRAEAVTIVNRVLNRAPHEDHLLDEDEMNVWPDNVYGAWYYADMQEATNSHDYDWIRVSGERVEEWTEKLPERDWAALEQEWSSAYSG